MSIPFIDSAGVGPDVVLLHGLPQPPSDLAGLAAELATDFRTHLLHLPGYGRSAEAIPHDLGAVAASVAGALVEANVERAAFIGSSGGFYRALQVVLADEAPHAWALIGLGAVAGLDAESREGFTQTAAAIRSAGMDLSDAMVARMLSPAFAEAHPQARAHVAASLRAASAQQIAAELEAFAAAEDLLPKVPTIRVPIYLRVGELDVATPPDMSAAIADAAPNGRVDVVRGAGHLLLLEDYAATAVAVRQALTAADSRV